MMNGKALGERKLFKHALENEMWNYREKNERKREPDLCYVHVRIWEGWTGTEDENKGDRTRQICFKLM